MGTAEAIVAILSASATVLGCLGSLLWWTYRRGQASGVEKAKREADQRAQAQADAKIQALVRLVAETRAELASMQPKRRRLPAAASAGAAHSNVSVNETTLNGLRAAIGSWQRVDTSSA